MFPGPRADAERKNIFLFIYLIECIRRTGTKTNSNKKSDRSTSADRDLLLDCQNLISVSLSLSHTHTLSQLFVRKDLVVVLIFFDWSILVASLFWNWIKQRYENKSNQSINERINDSVRLGSPYLSNLPGHLSTLTSRFFIHNTSYSCRHAASAWSSRLTRRVSVGYWPALRNILCVWGILDRYFCLAIVLLTCLLVVGPAYFIYYFFFPLEN